MASATPRRSRLRLGLWAAVPALGAVALIAIATQLHERSCDAASHAQPLGTVFEVLGVGGMALLLIGTMRRTGRGGRLDAGSRRVIGPLLVALALVALLAGFGAERNQDPLVAVYLGALVAAALYGLLVTVAAFVALVVYWSLGRDPDRTGFLLPAYLSGIGLLVYLPAFLLGSLVVGGCVE